MRNILVVTVVMGVVLIAAVHGPGGVSALARVANRQLRQSEYLVRAITCNGEDMPIYLLGLGAVYGEANPINRPKICNQKIVDRELQPQRRFEMGYRLSSLGQMNERHGLAEKLYSKEAHQMIFFPAHQHTSADFDWYWQRHVRSA
jgi:hypothetical protein